MVSVEFLVICMSFLATLPQSACLAAQVSWDIAYSVRPAAS